MKQFILGTDWWTDCDDAVALRLLARAHKAGEITLLGIAVNACMPQSIPSIDGFLQTEGVEDVPLGIDLDATDYGGNPPYQARLVAHAKRYLTNEDAEDAVALYRRLLAAADEPVELIEMGYPQVLAALLASGADEVSPLDGTALVAQKVSRIWMMGGRWDIPVGLENNFMRNARSRVAAHAVLATCPVPITLLGWEVGRDVITGTALAADDPLYLALADHGSPRGRYSWDPMLCLLAIIGDERAAGYASVTGRATVDPASGANTFKSEIDGPHRFVVKERGNTYYADAVEARIR